MSETSGRGLSDKNFMMVAGALLLAIILMMAALWLGTRKRALAAEARVAQLGQQLQALQMQMVMGQGPGGRLQIGIDRRGLTTRQAVLDGQKTQVLVMPAELGELLGFAPGDVVVVLPAAATAPAEAPTTASKAAMATAPASSRAR